MEERYPSVVPLLPPLTDRTIEVYAKFYVSALGVIILFGGLLAPTLEVKLGLGGGAPASESCQCCLLACFSAGSST